MQKSHNYSDLNLLVLTLYPYQKKTNDEKNNINFNNGICFIFL